MQSSFVRQTDAELHHAKAREAAAFTRSLQQDRIKRQNRLEKIRRKRLDSEARMMSNVESILAERILRSGPSSHAAAMRGVSPRSQQTAGASGRYEDDVDRHQRRAAREQNRQTARNELDGSRLREGDSLRRLETVVRREEEDHLANQVELRKEQALLELRMLEEMDLRRAHAHDELRMLEEVERRKMKAAAEVKVWEEVERRKHQRIEYEQSVVRAGLRALPGGTLGHVGGGTSSAASSSAVGAGPQGRMNAGTPMPALTEGGEHHHPAPVGSSGRTPQEIKLVLSAGDGSNAEISLPAIMLPPGTRKTSDGSLPRSDFGTGVPLQGIGAPLQGVHYNSPTLQREQREVQCCWKGATNHLHTRSPPPSTGDGERGS